MSDKIKMLQSVPGTVNGGLKVVHYKKGIIYKTVDMSEEVVETFLDNNYAEEYIKPVEVERHEKGLSGAPLNKRDNVPKNKTVYTAEELEGAKAKDIRKLAKENNVDLSGSQRNTSAETLISMYLERQDN